MHLLHVFIQVNSCNRTSFGSFAFVASGVLWPCPRKVPHTQCCGHMCGSTSLGQPTPRQTRHKYWLQSSLDSQPSITQWIFSYDNGARDTSWQNFLWSLLRLQPIHAQVKPLPVTAESSVTWILPPHPLLLGRGMTMVGKNVVMCRECKENTFEQLAN
jgi:hypothetical protein